MTVCVLNSVPASLQLQIVVGAWQKLSQTGASVILDPAACRFANLPCMRVLATHTKRFNQAHGPMRSPRPDQDKKSTKSHTSIY